MAGGKGREGAREGARGDAGVSIIIVNINFDCIICFYGFPSE